MLKSLCILKKQAKRLTKKYPSLKVEIANLISTLVTQPEQGTAMGKGCYKIRLAVGSKGKGKSGGARIITHVQVVKQKVYLLSIYDKSEMENLSEDELKSLLKAMPN